MKTHDAELLQIKELLHKNPKGMKITRIARDLAMNRNAAAKFLEILLMTGQVEVLEHGMSKIFILSRRTGIPTMLDRSADFILVFDDTMKISQVNENYLKFTGLKQDDLLGKRPDAANLPVISRQNIIGKIREAYSGADARAEIKEQVAGEEFFFDVRFTPTVFNDGRRGTTLIIEDITQEKKNEISLKESEAKNRKLVEEILSCIDDAVILVDAGNTAISFMNPAAGELFGCKRNEYLGKRPDFLFGGGTVPHQPGGLQDVFVKQACCTMESVMKRNGSKEFPVNLNLRPIFDDDGKLRYMVMVVRDMTAQKREDRRHSDAWNPQLPLSSRIVSAGGESYRTAI